LTAETGEKINQFEVPEKLHKTGRYWGFIAVLNGTLIGSVANERHIVQVPLIVKAHNQTLKELKKHIAEIDKELDRIIRQNPTISRMTNQLKSIPGVGLLLAADLIATTGAFKYMSNYKTLSAFIGICPYQHASGTSVYRQPRIRSFGPNHTRKLLMLAARSCATHNILFRKYYMRKLAEGKAKQLVLNNISNKIIKIACALVKNNTHFNEKYCSVNPLCFNLA